MDVVEIISTCRLCRNLTFLSREMGLGFFPDIDGWEDTVDVPYVCFLKNLEKGSS